MKEEILDIAKKLYHNHLTPETATNLLLDLFAVSSSVCCGEKLIEFKTYGYNECPECGKTYKQTDV